MATTSTWSDPTGDTPPPVVGAARGAVAGSGTGTTRRDPAGRSAAAGAARTEASVAPSSFGECNCPDACLRDHENE